MRGQFDGTWGGREEQEPKERGGEEDWRNWMRSAEQVRGLEPGGPTHCSSSWQNGVGAGVVVGEVG